MRAPAMYSVIAGPGTLEISTLPAGGSFCASLERPYSDARLVMIHGAPVTGMSTPSTGLSSRTTALAASDEAWIALKRSATSAMSVARSTRTIDTWLFIASSPAARRLTGTAAISGCLGSSPRSFKKRRNALAHSAMTMVLTVPPTRVPSAFTSASGTDQVLNERWLVIESLNSVFGARPRISLRSPLAVRWLVSTLPAAVSALAADGSSVASLRYCVAELVSAACSISVTPSWSPSARLRRGGGTSRIFGETSYSTLASSTPALPSTPLWCALV